MQVNIHEAKSQLSKLGELVVNGERVVIAKSGKPYLDLIPHREQQEPRTPGRLKGQIHMAEDFDRTPEEVVAAFEEG
jgi:antitoxin (DNA-binding transcriptional repressor) of toxin-antitoxin stability system